MGTHTNGRGRACARSRSRWQIWKRQPDGQWRFAREIWNSRRHRSERSESPDPRGTNWARWLFSVRGGTFIDPITRLAVTDVVASALAEALRDRYTIERELGRGGMATVYLAREVKHGRKVALKVLRPELAAVLGRERFLAEIGLTARLDHPNILTLLDSGSAGEALFYAMPLVQGGSLRDRLQQERHLSIEEAVRIGSQIAAALEHAHALGIIHRDIKPENILLHEGVPVLTDFGIALAVREAGGQRLTETGLVLGTPHYMSPEQATGDPLLDPRSDIYSLGAVVYEMLAGEPPFLGVSAQAIVARLITSRPTPLRVMRDTLPEWLAAAVDKSLAKIPADRYASAAEFANSLTTAPPAVPAAAAPSRRRRIPVVAGITALGVAVALSAGWWFARRPPATPPPSESMVAVLPPDISTPDSALSHLARDLAFTLAPNLTGAGEIRAVDPDAVVAQLGNRTVARSRPADLRLGRSLGAGLVVRGSLVRVGRQVRWDLDLLSTENGDLVAQATATALPESLRAFTDTATRSLLRQIWLHGQPPSPSLDAAVKTRLMPALKAFLTGEGRIEGNWGGAAQAYNDVAADSSFWLAYWRLWYTRAWGADVDTTLFAAVRAHREELPDSKTNRTKYREKKKNVLLSGSSARWARTAANRASVHVRAPRPRVPEPPVGQPEAGVRRDSVVVRLCRPAPISLSMRPSPVRNALRAGIDRVFTAASRLGEGGCP